jgi:hypothetical protein
VIVEVDPHLHQHSQGANGPASMPTRSKLTPVATRNAAMASGSIAAFAHDPTLVVDDADRRVIAFLIRIEAFLGFVAGLGQRCA